AATFYDGVAGSFGGYARFYQEGSGWSAPGLNFLKVASAGASHLGYATIAPGPGGLIFVHFSRLGSSSDRGVFYNGSWQPDNAGGQGIYRNYLPDSFQFESDAYAAVIDSLGRAHLVHQDSGDS